MKKERYITIKDESGRDNADNIAWIFKQVAPNGAATVHDLGNGREEHQITFKTIAEAEAAFKAVAKFIKKFKAWKKSEDEVEMSRKLIGWRMLYHGAEVELYRKDDDFAL